MSLCVLCDSAVNSYIKRSIRNLMVWHLLPFPPGGEEGKEIGCFLHPVEMPECPLRIIILQIPPLLHYKSVTARLQKCYKRLGRVSGSKFAVMPDSETLNLRNCSAAIHFHRRDAEDAEFSCFHR